MALSPNGTPGPAPTPAHADISLPLNRPAQREKWSPELDAKMRAQGASNIHIRNLNPVPRAFWQGGDRSLSGIAIRAFLLGVTMGLSTLCSLVILFYYQNPLWRAPFFVAILCIFHFLEFWTTAEYNTPTAFVSSFLLANGSRYRQAHTFALIESIITSYFFPGWQARVNPPSVIMLGLGMVIVGQVVRSLAMAQAGTNFNHQVQSQKNEGHELVTSGLYSVFRHPSYFGFFWWGLGTQVALGNCVSFVGYAGVLWYFFSTRIRHEEKHLIVFFGDEYKAYRERTRVWIPFI
ncbi:prenyl cysteine carboxyl methyltransferas-like protein Ste14 [Clohesyomyces aquaticus]|uniref:Protein-S-isoprenylcysteine O-methyltransferase n=1 Tax=Clohesyomyces aquaticus TaxID=1231657 RepID=A0A1Y1ZXZ5_9PLEO|nr:prenyl cysteine carboxyl methyltransferas-like protein Ste14 [Clohesyomyces aquaticus]